MAATTPKASTHERGRKSASKTETRTESITVNTDCSFQSTSERATTTARVNK